MLNETLKKLDYPNTVIKEYNGPINLHTKYAKLRGKY